MEDIILDVPDQPKSTRPKMQLILLIIVILEIAVETFVYYNIPDMTRSWQQKIIFCLLMFPLLIPGAGLFLGLLFSLIPFKGLRYADKYLKFSLIAMALLEGAMLVWMLVRFY